MRPLGALQHLTPAYRAAAVARRGRAQVAQQETVQDLSYVVDRSWSADTAGTVQAEPSFRQLPINFSPETRFTVDNVAAADAARFQLHPSVGAWARFSTRFTSVVAPGRTGLTNTYDPDAASRQRLDDLATTIRDLLSTSALADAESAAYWTYHLGRTGFFLGVSVTGAIAHHLAEQFTALRSGAQPKRTPLQNLSSVATEEISNRLAEALAMYRSDLGNIKAGQYKLPWDMTTPTHRQYNPLFVLGKSAQFVSEAIATLNRRVSQAPPDNWLSSNMYPAYYADNTFHYQSDGWFSSRSADIYEFSTESLFFGRQDAMQRTSLLPLAAHIKARGLDPGAMRVTEVCCGTGRFHTFLKDNYPTMSTIASDLSPFYLAKARDNVAYWKSQRAAGLNLGGADNTGTEYIQCAAESLPLPANSLDAIICMYAFHEMPEEARAAVAGEMHRVLKPGGLAVLTDSVQLGDRPEWDATLGAFGNFNEPHFRNFIACDFGSMFEAAGFACDTKYVASATKTLSFIKPDGGAEPAAAAAAAAADTGSFGAAAAMDNNPELN